MLRVQLENGLFIFGLDAENVRRLTEDKEPIFVDTTEMGGTDKFVLMYGETLKDVQKQIEDATGVPFPSVN